MNFSYYIAKRYLYSKSSNSAINIITIIASFGIIVGSIALFIILSGFSGLRTFSYSLLDAADPDIKITSVKGKSFILSNNNLQKLIENDNIDDFSSVIEERVFLEYNDKNEIAYIKGVKENYTNITKIDSSLSIGSWLNPNYSNTAVAGRIIALKLSMGIRNFTEPLTIMVPKPGKGFINPNNAFYKTNVQIVGLYTGTEAFESKFVFVDFNLAKDLLKFKSNEITSTDAGDKQAVHQSWRDHRRHAGSGDPGSAVERRGRCNRDPLGSHRGAQGGGAGGEPHRVRRECDLHHHVHLRDEQGKVRKPAG